MLGKKHFGRGRGNTDTEHHTQIPSYTTKPVVDNSFPWFRENSDSFIHILHRLFLSMIQRKGLPTLEDTRVSSNQLH